MAFDPDEDVASKFFEHFVAITHAMNTLGGTGLWDEQDGYYYDQMHVDGRTERLRICSMVGVIPLFAVEVLEECMIEKLAGFDKRMHSFLANRPELARHVTHQHDEGGPARVLLAVPSVDRLVPVLRYVLDENELLSPFGVRSLSRFHATHPFVLQLDGEEHRVDYTPAESTTGLFGGNSNWRGSVWFPLNYLLIEALERYHHFYGEGLQVECPTGSGRMRTLQQVADELAQRLTALFVPDAQGHRPCLGNDPRVQDNALWRSLLPFHEYFDGDNGRGCGASHQTGWTALVARCLSNLAHRRRGTARTLAVGSRR